MSPILFKATVFFPDASLEGISPSGGWPAGEYSGGREAWLPAGGSFEENRTHRRPARGLSSGGSKAAGPEAFPARCREGRSLCDQRRRGGHRLEGEPGARSDAGRLRGLSGRNAAEDLEFLRGVRRQGAPG